MNENTLFLAGDINVDMISAPTPREELLTLLDSYGFSSLVHVPARIAYSTATSIDLIITNTDTRGSSARTILSDVSDHLPVFAFLPAHSSYHITKGPLPCYRRIDTTALDRFFAAMSEMTWDDVLSLKDVNDAYDALIVKIKAIYDK